MAAAGLPEANDPRKRSLLVLMFGDFIVTALWVMASSCFAEASAYLAEYTGMDELLLGIGVLLTTVTLFGPVCGFFGGALFNPIHNVSLMSSGRGTVAGHLVRMSAQLAGALAGSLAAKLYLPEWLQGKFHTLSGGIKDGVAFEVGFACEGTMSFVLNYVFLLAHEADSHLLRLWTPMVSTAILSWIGYYFTGPSLNPFVSFSWHLHYKRQNDMEHYLVFWSAPILGAVAAGLSFVSREKFAHRKGRRPSKAAIAARGQKTLQQQHHHHHHNHHDHNHYNHNPHKH